MSEHIDAAQYIAEIRAFRQEKNRFFASSAQSPIPAAQRRAGFTGLRYYEPDLAFRVAATLIPFDTPEVVPLGSTMGDIRQYVRYGELHFTIVDQECRLTAYKDAETLDSDDLFIPFKDATSNSTTYGAGRYIEVEGDSAEAGPRTITLDFNQAYNPWCAYNANYSCTLPPVENTLPIAILAGEKTYVIAH